MKRDDLIDFAFGGNKVRLFEYLAADIIEKKANKIITFGSVHSNHTRVAAIVANKLGIACDLIILYDGHSPDSNAPNLRLIKYCTNIHLEFCPTDQAHDFIDSYLDMQKQERCNYYWIPGGGHTTVAAQGYIDAAHEILEQAYDLNIDAIFLPCGTGTTQAGLIAGINNQIPIYGITVARNTKRCKKEIETLLSQMGYRYVSGSEINVLPCQIKYGDKSEEVQSLIKEICGSDGIMLDPVYNAKSFLTTKHYLKMNSSFRNVIYLNTGGSPNLF